MLLYWLLLFFSVSEDSFIRLKKSPSDCLAALTPAQWHCFSFLFLSAVRWAMMLTGLFFITHTQFLNKSIWQQQPLPWWKEPYTEAEGDKVFKKSKSGIFRISVTLVILLCINLKVYFTSVCLMLQEPMKCKYFHLKFLSAVRTYTILWIGLFIEIL